MGLKLTKEGRFFFTAGVAISMLGGFLSNIFASSVMKFTGDSISSNSILLVVSIVVFFGLILYMMFQLHEIKNE